jgi:CRP-like cAMP-binding protein
VSGAKFVPRRPLPCGPFYLSDSCGLHVRRGRLGFLNRFAFPASLRRLRALLLLANFGKEGKPDKVIGKISQETLAEMIGTTRSRVSFFMNKFRKLGFVKYNGTLEVHSSLLNVVLHD